MDISKNQYRSTGGKAYSLHYSALSQLRMGGLLEFQYAQDKALK